MSLLETRVKPLPVLSDMPDNIKEMIAESTDVKTRYTLRKVSTHFRSAVDASKFCFGKVTIGVSEGKIYLYLSPEANIVYCNIKPQLLGLSKTMVHEYEKEQETKKILEGENYMERAVKDFKIIMKSKKCLLEELTMIGFPTIRSPQPWMLSFFQDILHVARFIIGGTNQFDQNFVVQVLQHLKAGILKTLIVETMDKHCDDIVRTEHWMLLEEARVGNVGGVPISKFLHLKKCSMTEFSLTKDGVEEIVQAMLQRPDCEKFSFLVIESNKRLKKSYKQAVSQYLPPRNRISIPGTTDWLHINHRSDTVTFERKKEK